MTIVHESADRPALRPRAVLAIVATAALAYLSTAASGRINVRLSLAGHPPAMVVRRDGTVASAGTYGDMLALADDPTFRETRLLLDPEAETQLSPDQREQATYIETSARDLLGLVDELLDLAAAESGRLDASAEPERPTTPNTCPGATVRSTASSATRSPAALRKRFVTPSSRIISRLPAPSRE